MKSRTAGMGIEARLAVSLAGMLAIAAHAVEIQKADNTDALALGSSWRGGTAPSADDTALFDGDATPNATNWVYGLGGDVVWGGIRATNHADSLSVTNDGSRLSLGAGGMDVTLGSHQVSFDVPITLTASQTWRSSSMASNLFWRPVGGTGSLTLGAGWFAFYDPLTMSGGVNVASGAGMYVRSNAVVNGAVSVSNGGTLLVNKPVATEWRQSFASGSVINDGIFTFGRVGGSPAITQSAVSLKTGDRLIRAAAVEDGNRGRVNILDNDVRMEGGEITANWWYLYSGSYTQTQGTAYSDYAMYVGFGYDGPAVARTVMVEGGKLDVRRFHVGAVSSESRPGVLEIRGGEVQAVRANSPAYTGIDLAAVRTEGEWVTASTSAAELNVSGGSLRTAQIRFGSTDVVRGDAWNVTNGYVRFTLSGGEVTVGSFGIGPHAVWNRASGIPQECATAWYETLFSGGTLGAYASTINWADTRLSDAHGGVTFRAADTDGTPYTITQRGALYGSGGLRKTGAGTLVLASAVNTYTGKTVVAEGTLALDVSFGVMTARWTADTLAVSPGGTVSEWPCALGESYWKFTHGVATAIRSTATAPILAPETMNGHKAVRFNGGTDALGMSGVPATTPVSGANRLTVAAVVRPRGPGKGGGSQIVNAAGIVGSQMVQGSGGLWALAINQNGAVGSGVSLDNSASSWSAVWDGTTNVVDSQPHVVIYTWTQGAELTVNVDGARTRLTDAVPGNVLAKTRMLMGSNENGLGFDGDIAEIQFYKDTVLSDAEQDMLGASLAYTYGATYTANSGVSDPVLIPDSPAVWSPDTLTGAPGAELAEWPSTNGVWKFTSALATQIGNSHNRTFDAPTIGTTLMNGYRVVSFNGITDAMAMTGGGASTPTSGATNLTVAVVMRSDGVGVGGYANDWRSGTAGIIGQVYDDNWWGLTYNAYGRAGAWIGGDTNNFLSAWGAPRNLNDGEPHVLIYVWQNGSNVTMNVDGWRSVTYDTEQVHTAARVKTRCMLGATEKTCARVDIAEIHHYQTAFTPEQQNALGLALARKYGAETYGYLRDPGSGAPVLASRVVQIDAGATFKTASGGTRIEPEQCFTGAGAVTGTLVVGADGVIATATDAALTVENLTFEAGGVCRWAYGADGSHTPLAVNGTLSLPAGTVVVEIDSVVANPAAYGVVMTWSGLLDDHGAVWEVRGGRTQTTVIVDTEAKQIRLATPTGTLLSIR